MQGLYLIAQPDGTDEQRSLRTYTVNFQEGETAGDALARTMREEYENDWEPEDWGEPGSKHPDDDPWENFKCWWESFSWQVNLWSPHMLADKIREECDFDEAHGPWEDWLTREQAIKVMDALRLVEL